MSVAIYTLIPQGELNDLISTLSDCLSLPIRLLDEQGAQLFFSGMESHYCTLFEQNAHPLRTCEQVHLNAGRNAGMLGESYIFSCHGNLNHIAFPLLRHEALLATILVGPFLMDTPDSTLISDLLERHTLPPALCLSMYDELTQLPVVPPARVSQIGRLITRLFTPLLPDVKSHLTERQEKLYQQSRINETVQMYKGIDVPKASTYPYEKERELLTKVKCGDFAAAKAVLNDLLGYVLFAEGGNMDIVKSRSLELTTLLSRVAIEGGALIERIYPLNHAFLSRLRDLVRYEDICYQLQDVVESFMNSVSMPETHGGNVAIRACIRHIATHYQEPLSLSDAAALVNLSPSYFSALFTKVMGVNFRDYLNRVRIDEAKRLLRATDYPISQIAISVGFSDQSYFSKVFKRETMLSPNQYR